MKRELKVKFYCHSDGCYRDGDCLHLSVGGIDICDYLEISAENPPRGGIYLFAKDEHSFSRFYESFKRDFMRFVDSYQKFVEEYGRPPNEEELKRLIEEWLKEGSDEGDKG